MSMGILGRTLSGGRGGIQEKRRKGMFSRGGMHMHMHMHDSESAQAEMSKTPRDKARAGFAGTLSRPVAGRFWQSYRCTGVPAASALLSPRAHPPPCGLPVGSPVAPLVDPLACSAPH